MKLKKADKTLKRKDNTNVLSHKKVTSITSDKSMKKWSLSEKEKKDEKKIPVNKKNKVEKNANYKDNTKELSHESNIGITSDKTALVAFNKPVIQTKLLNLANISDDLAEMLKHYKEKVKNVIEIPKLEVNKKRATGKVITRSFRIYEGILKDFLKFAEKHDQFTIQDLLSQAIIELLERYHN